MMQEILITAEDLRQLARMLEQNESDKEPLSIGVYNLGRVALFDIEVVDGTPHVKVGVGFYRDKLEESFKNDG